MGDVGGGTFGAYGLRLDPDSGLDASFLVEAAAEWTPWALRTIVVRPGDERLDRSRHAEFLTAHTARIFHESGARIDISRQDATSVLIIDHEPNADELAHPYLGHTGAVVAWWEGHFAIHGACATRNGRAVGLLGAREQGKSTTLAHMVERGWSPVSDDLLVIDGSAVRAGPRCLDLRETTATRWGLGDDIGVVGARRRWRVRTERTSAETELAALVELHWGPSITVTPVAVEDRLEAVFAHRTLDVRPRNGSAMFGLLGRPFLRVTRPRSLESVEPLIDAVLEYVGIAEDDSL